MVYITLLLSLPFQANAAVVTWDGRAKEAVWSGPGRGGNDGDKNWDRSSPPVNGDALAFDGASFLTNINNIDGLSIVGITFNTGADAFVIDGNQITLAGDITNSSINTQTISLALGLSAGDRTLAATAGDIAIGGVISGSGGITKTGDQKVTLTGSNSYTGTTNVSAGTLLADNSSGSATGSGAVNVGVNGTLGGTGTIAPTGNNSITVSGIIAPGDGSAPGALTFDLSSTTGSLVMSSGSSFQLHLGVPQSSASLFILGATSGKVVFNNNTVDFMGTGSLGSYKLFDTDSNNANTWSGLTVDANGKVTGGLNYSNLANGYNANFYIGGNSFGGDSGDLYVQVIPEPSTALLCGLGFLILFHRRR
jgi:autotransporter-associated beta strand protein